jgi:hypothetical protein
MVPDFRPAAMNIWARAACAQLVLQGAELEAARSMLNMRAADLGYAITHNAAVRLVGDGVTVLPKRHGDTLRFVLPRTARVLRLCSASAIPAHVADLDDDHRRLGVMVHAATVDGVKLDLGGLADGWHALENDGPRRWRWTDGDAALPGGRVVTIEVDALPMGYIAAAALERRFTA